MIAKIIEYSARNKFIVFLFVFFALAWGYWTVRNILEILITKEIERIRAMAQDKKSS